MTNRRDIRCSIVWRNETIDKLFIKYKFYREPSVVGHLCNWKTQNQILYFVEDFATFEMRWC